MNILDIQDKLKNFSQEQLIQEMQMPTGQLPQFLLLSEITRRKKMQDSYAQQQDQAQEQTTVAQDAVNAAGIPQGAAQQLAGTMAPQTDMAGNTGAAPQQMMPQAPQPAQGMAGGGIVALQDGGRVTAPRLVVRDGRQFAEMADGSLIPMSELGYDQETSTAAASAPRGFPMDLGPEGYLELPTQADLDQRYNESRLGIDSMRADMDAPSVGDVPAIALDTAPAAPRQAPGMDAPFTNRLDTAEGYLALPTQAELDQRFQDEQFGIDRARAGLTAPSVGDVPAIALDTAPAAPRQAPARPVTPTMPSASAIHGPSGMLYGEMSTQQLGALANGGDRLAAEVLMTLQPPAGPRMPTELATTTVTPARIPATPMSYEQILAAAGAGQMPTYDTLAASADLLNDQQAADVSAMIDSGYMPDADEQRVSSMQGETRFEPDAPYIVQAGPVTAAVSDYFAGVFGGRTIGEQAEIDAERARLSGGLSETPPEVLTPDETTLRPRARPDAPPEGLTPDAPETTPPGPPGPRGPSGGGIAGAAAQGAAAPSDFEQELMTMLAAREKRAEQDKFLALAQAGMQLMSSTQPTFGGALGEAGAAGLAALREGQSGAEADRLALLGQIEQSRMGREKLDLERQALAARSAARGSGGAKSLPAAALTDLMGQLSDAETQLAQLPPQPTGFFGRAKQDPNAGARAVLANRVDQLRDILNVAGAPFGVPLGGGTGGDSPPSVLAPSAESN